MSKRFLFSLSIILGTIALLMPIQSHASEDKASHSPLSSIQQVSQTKGSEDVSIRLIDQGAEPRKELRYKFKGGETDTLVVEMKMAIAVELGGQKRPAVWAPMTRIVTTVESKSVSPEGDLFVESTVTAIDMVSDPESDIKMTEATRKLKEKLQSLMGCREQYTLTPQGISKNAETSHCSAGSQEGQQTMDNLRQPIAMLPFPDEPVGKGARWEVTTPVSNSKFILSQVVTYTLRDMNEDKVSVETMVKQDAPPGELTTVPGAEVKLEAFESRGSAVIETSLTKPIPLLTLLKMNISMVLAMTQKTKITTQIEIRAYKKDEQEIIRGGPENKHEEVGKHENIKKP
jgi:hypothetical protein